MLSVIHKAHAIGHPGRFLPSIPEAFLWFFQALCLIHAEPGRLGIGMADGSPPQFPSCTLWPSWLSSSRPLSPAYLPGQPHTCIDGLALTSGLLQLSLQHLQPLPQLLLRSFSPAGLIPPQSCEKSQSSPYNGLRVPPNQAPRA